MILCDAFLGIKPILLSLEDLRFRFPKTEVTATLQCGGNRRSGFNEGGRKTSGIAWGFGVSRWPASPFTKLNARAHMYTPLPLPPPLLAPLQ